MTQLPLVPAFADVEGAARRIAPFAVRTPFVESHALGLRTGARVFLKLETLQRTGSFKFRGALNRLLLIPEDARANGVVAFSSGNHAQGVAAAAALLGMDATIVMPEDAPRSKIDGTRSFGANVVFYDRHRDDREAIAARLCGERGATLVKPFDDAGVVAGQGTVGLEIGEEVVARSIPLDLLLVPAGGGGIVSGTALGLGRASPRTEVMSVEPEAYDGMRQSLLAGARTKAQGGPVSIADALMAPSPGEIPFALAKERLSGGLAVSDADLMRAVSFAAKRLKLMVEPGGAAALAALLSGKVDTKGKTIGVVLTGGNCDIDTIARACAEVPEP
jgi:threonine dehydratase